MTRVYMRHARGDKQNKNCTRGIRYFFKRHGLNYSDFVFNGIDSDKVLATKDPEALLAIKKAEQEERSKR